MVIEKQSESNSMRDKIRQYFLYGFVITKEEQNRCDKMARIIVNRSNYKAIRSLYFKLRIKNAKKRI